MPLLYVTACVCRGCMLLWWVCTHVCVCVCVCDSHSVCLHGIVWSVDVSLGWCTCRLSCKVLPYLAIDDLPVCHFMTSYTKKHITVNPVWLHLEHFPMYVRVRAKVLVVSSTKIWWVTPGSTGVYAVPPPPNMWYSCMQFIVMYTNVNPLCSLCYLTDNH